MMASCTISFHPFAQATVTSEAAKMWGRLGSEENPVPISIVEKLHAQNISVKPHGLRHVLHPKSDRRNFPHRRCHTPRVYLGSA